MSKGFEWSVSILIAVILLIFSVAIFWNYITGSRPPQCSDGIDNDGDGLTDYPYDTDCENEKDNSESVVSLEKQFCDTDADCLTNPDGKKCLQVYPGGCTGGNINQTCFKPFCGCISNIDCGGYICGSDNKCTKRMP